MCDPHVDDILQYLSSKLNVIFCDREFVGSVNEDLKLLSNYKGRCCVLVFPVLGPIFLRAIRYQAKILDFAAFSIGSGYKKAAAVCLRNYLVEKIENVLPDASTSKMDVETGNTQQKDDGGVRRNKGRPAMQLYVPPARRQRQPKKTETKNKRGAKPQVNKSSDSVNEVPLAVNESVASNSGVDSKVKLEIQDAPSLVAVGCNHEKSEIINGKSEKDCVLSAPLSKDEDIKKLETSTSNLIIKTKDDEVEKEREEMRRACERMNRKSKSIIKYIDNTDTLKIEVDSKTNKTLKPSENLTNWEDMFDESGELKEVYLEEIVKHVGNEVTILKTNEDYSSYQNKKVITDLDHVIELYDFPPSFKTCDIVQLYSELQCDNMYIKWVDDTHALLVLSTPVQAKRALQIQNGLIKSRPISEASGLSQSVAFKNDLKPAMKRPQTSLQTARRLITTHLGAKSTLSKEVLEQERKILRDAREQKRQERQSERDAWEGNPRPSTA